MFAVEVRDYHIEFHNEENLIDNNEDEDLVNMICRVVRLRDSPAFSGDVLEKLLPIVGKQLAEAGFTTEESQ